MWNNRQCVPLNWGFPSSLLALHFFARTHNNTCFTQHRSAHLPLWRYGVAWKLRNSWHPVLHAETCARSHANPYFTQRHWFIAGPSVDAHRAQDFSSSCGSTPRPVWTFPAYGNVPRRSWGESSLAGNSIFPNLERLPKILQGTSL